MMIFFMISGLILLNFFISNPLAAALNLMLLTVLIGGWMGFSIHMWIFYLTALMFLGGVMVLFIYMTSLVSSTKLTSYYTKINFKLTIMMIIIFWLMLSKDFNTTSDFKSVSILFNNTEFLSLGFITMYLLLILIISVKLTQKSQGGVKSTFSKKW